MKILMVAASILLISSIALSNSTQLGRKRDSRKRPDPCIHPHTTEERNRCSAKHYSEALQELYGVYIKLREKSDREEYQNALNSAQDAWEQYRDTHCDFDNYHLKDSDIYIYSRNVCLIIMTRDRTAQLRSLLKTK